MKHIENEIKRELRTRGIELGIQEVEVVKNQIPCTGIRVINPKHPDISPIVYYSEKDSMEEIMERIFWADYQETPNFNLGSLTDPDYLADHLYLAVVKRNGENSGIIRKPYLNLDLIMKVSLDSGEDPSGTLSTKVTPEQLEVAGLCEDDAWKLARANSKSTAKIRSMSEILQEMGFPVGVGEVPMYVASCNDGADGASVLSLPDVFRAFCEERQIEELYLLPSSTQELVVVPVSSSPTTSDLVHMVDDINRGEVDPLIQLDPAVYIYRLSDSSIDLIEVLEEV